MPSRDSSAVLVVTGAELSARAEALSGSTVEIPTGIDFSVQPLLLRPIETGITFAITPGIQVKIEVGMQMRITAAEADFGYSRDLVAAAQSDLSETVTDFVLIGQTFTDPTFRTVANGGRVASDDGDDIKLTASNVVQLAHNLITYGDSTGAVLYDLKFPTWTFTNDVRHRLFYGNAGIVAPLSDPAGCYSRTAAVWTWPLGLDISGNGRNLTVVDIDGPEPEYELPANPVDVKASYDGTTYYVGPSGAGHSKTTEGDPGAFEATIENANDKSRIIVLPGNYGAFTATPKSGQTGRLMIQAKNPTHTGVDLSGVGSLIGFDAGGDHSVITGQVNFVGFQNLWFEGFRMGAATGTADQPGSIRIYGNVPSTSRSWYVRNWHHNTVTNQVLLGDEQKFVHYQNFHWVNARPGDRWASDYHLFLDDGSIRETYVVENIFRGGHNQALSLKQEQINVFIHGNIFDAQYLVDGEYGGTMLFLGQGSDKVGDPDRTIHNAVISYNKFYGVSEQVFIHVSNIQDCLIENNTFEKIGSGGTVGIRLYTGSNEPATVTGPIHPRNWTIQSNTFIKPENMRFEYWRTFVKETVQRTNILFQNNTAASNIVGFIEPADSNFSGGGSDYQADAKLRVTYGENAKATAPPNRTIGSTTYLTSNLMDIV